MSFGFTELDFQPFHGPLSKPTRVKLNSVWFAFKLKCSIFHLALSASFCAIRHLPARFNRSSCLCERISIGTVSLWVGYFTLQSSHRKSLLKILKDYLPTHSNVYKWDLGEAWDQTRIQPLFSELLKFICLSSKWGRGSFEHLSEWRT